MLKLLNEFQVTDVRRDMRSIQSKVDMVHHHVKDELEDLRECVDRIDDEQSRHRKKRLLEQVRTRQEGSFLEYMPYNTYFRICWPESLFLNSCRVP